MRLAGLLTIATGGLLLAGHGHAASLLGLLRHALRVLS
jgi:hypothetical protein